MKFGEKSQAWVIGILECEERENIESQYQK